jgi:hypothetical protein
VGHTTSQKKLTHATHIDRGATQFFQGVNRAKYDLGDRMSRYAILRDRQLAEYNSRTVAQSECCEKGKKGKKKKCGCAVKSAQGAKGGVPAVQDVDADGFGAFRAPLADEAWAKGPHFTRGG